METLISRTGQPKFALISHSQALNTDSSISSGLSRGSSADGLYQFQIAGVFVDAYGYGDVTFTHSQITSTADTPTQIISVSSSMCKPKSRDCDFPSMMGCLIRTRLTYAMAFS